MLDKYIDRYVYAYYAPRAATTSDQVEEIAGYLFQQDGRYHLSTGFGQVRFSFRPDDVQAVEAEGHDTPAIALWGPLQVLQAAM